VIYSKTRVSTSYNVSWSFVSHSHTNDDSPALSLKFDFDFFVTLDIPSELLFPELNATFRSVREPTVRVTVPEAAMHKDDRFVPRENDIGLAGQVFAVQAKPVPHAVQHRTDTDFGFGISSPNSRHVPAAVLLRQTIH
jgi:hypothetical protein